MNSYYRQPEQIIHPYFFGDSAMKRTCLWLKGLPCLVASPYSVKPDPISKNLLVKMFISLKAFLLLVLFVL